MSPDRPAGPTRRALLRGGLLSGGLLLAAASGSSGGNGSVRAMNFRGADLSFLPQEEAAGARFSDGAGTVPLERILAARGATHVRLRVWVNPVDGTNDLKSMLALGQRAHDAGMALYVSLHYSDTWADSSHQTPPAAWSGQSLADLAGTVEQYTRDVVTAFAAQGTPIELIQIGNEVENGLLWPQGWASPYYDRFWPNLFQLMAAGLAGARTPRSGSAPRTAIHLSTGGDNARCRQFFDQARAAGIATDLIALSYYPFWNGSLQNLSRNLDDLSTRYGTDVLIAETSYPWTLANADALENVVTGAGQLPDGDTCPPTPAGQQAFYDRLTAVMRAVPDGRGAGFVVWAPDWLAGVGATPELGNAHDNLTLFDHTGAGLPALAAFGRSV
jgi:arabinogalactan endo-1,4-beta-galactosidase